MKYPLFNAELQLSSAKLSPELKPFEALGLRESTRQKVLSTGSETDTGFKVDKSSNRLSVRKKIKSKKKWFSPPQRSWSEISSKFQWRIIGISVSLTSGRRLGKHQNANVMWGGGTEEENLFLWKKCTWGPRKYNRGPGRYLGIFVSSSH